MWIKVCGINDLVAARAIAELRPDAVGLNFYEQSVRFVSPKKARKFAAHFPPETAVIGVFVNAPINVIRQAIEECGLIGVQLHGQGAEDVLAQLNELDGADAPIGITTERIPASIKRIRAFAVGLQGLAEVAETFNAFPKGRSVVDAFLVDAHVEGKHGGTGRQAPWSLLRSEYRTEKWPPLILAGGLRPENVAAAIETVRPWGVDVASGVESAPGIKDVDCVARFIQEARTAFRKVEQASAVE